jgi:hypothetical protein
VTIRWALGGFPLPRRSESRARPIRCPSVLTQLEHCSGDLSLLPFVGGSSDIFSEPMASEELDDVGWHPIGREDAGDTFERYGAPRRLPPLDLCLRFRQRSRDADGGCTGLVFNRLIHCSWG